MAELDSRELKLSLQLQWQKSSNRILLELSVEEMECKDNCEKLRLFKK
ncbi:MAG: hypothetical protein FWC02_00715 [Firmicutes bacterium]|nr:hypothetical protein [Bacillota bacterium]